MRVSVQSLQSEGCSCQLWLIYTTDKTSAPRDTDARLFTLADVGLFDNCSGGLDADW